MTGKERWKEEPDDQDYPAALSYLSLVMTEERGQGVGRGPEEGPDHPLLREGPVAIESAGFVATGERARGEGPEEGFQGAKAFASPASRRQCPT